MGLSIQACSGPEAKEKINRAGDMAGETVGEFVSGVSSGVSKAFDVKVSLPEGLAQRGLAFGKVTVSSDSVGTDNLLTLYVIFEKDFKGNLIAKVYDDKQLEMGRVRVDLRGKAGEARFVEFHFDRRTNIDNDSRIVVE
jgi:hypothetical protein